MKKRLSILVAVCILGVLLAGCGAKETSSNVSDSGGSAVSEDITSSDPENENLPVEVSNSHDPIVSSTFELNGIRFWRNDNAEMECLILEEIQLAELTMNGVKCDIQVRDSEDTDGLYDDIKNSGIKGTNKSGDIAYAELGDTIWLLAIENGKLMTIYGIDDDESNEWQTIAGKLQWAVIDADNSGLEIEIAGAIDPMSPDMFANNINYDEIEKTGTGEWAGTKFDGYELFNHWDINGIRFIDLNGCGDGGVTDGTLMLINDDTIVMIDVTAKEDDRELWEAIKKGGTESKSSFGDSIYANPKENVWGATTDDVYIGFMWLGDNPTEIMSGIRWGIID